MKQLLQIFYLLNTSQIQKYLIEIQRETKYQVLSLLQFAVVLIDVQNAYTVSLGQ